jgi:hypothetical protein
MIMVSLKVVGKSAAAWLALTFAQIIAGVLVPIQVPPSPNMFVWLLASNLVVAVVLTGIAMNSRERGWRLALMLSGIPTGIAMINHLEGMVFLGHSEIDWKGVALSTGMVWALLIPVWKLLFGRRSAAAPVHQTPPTTRSPWERIVRFALSDVAYVLLYLIAGTIIFPFVQEYYSTQTVPPMGRIIFLQLALRGPIFVGICLLLMRLMELPRGTGALAVGLAFTLLSGVAPLIFPNPYLPDTVRWVHLCEVTGSNFIFGALVGWVWGEPKAVTTNAPAGCCSSRA